MKRPFLTASLVVISSILVSPTRAEDNVLSADEKKAGWQLLFNGIDASGWKCNNGKPVATPIEKGALVPYKSGGYIVLHERSFDDFIFKCDVKWEVPNCNSGIFFRVEDPLNPVHTGFEVQVMGGDKTGKHQFGAIYDLASTTVNAGKETGEWNHVVIHCMGPVIKVQVNGQDVCEINCDEMDQPGIAADGKKHKYQLNKNPRAIKDFARKGQLGFQDHGHKVWYKNVKLLPISKSSAK